MSSNITHIHEIIIRGLSSNRWLKLINFAHIKIPSDNKKRILSLSRAWISTVRYLDSWKLLMFFFLSYDTFCWNIWSCYTCMRRALYTDVFAISFHRIFYMLHIFIQSTHSPRIYILVNFYFTFLIHLFVFLCGFDWIIHFHWNQCQFNIFNAFEIISSGKSIFQTAKWFIANLFFAHHTHMSVLMNSIML